MKRMHLLMLIAVAIIVMMIAGLVTMRESGTRNIDNFAARVPLVVMVCAAAAVGLSERVWNSLAGVGTSIVRLMLFLCVGVVLLDLVMDVLLPVLFLHRRIAGVFAGPAFFALPISVVTAAVGVAIGPRK